MIVTRQANQSVVHLSAAAYESVPMVATPNLRPARLPALDWLRGFVMVLITVDHASGELNV